MRFEGGVEARALEQHIAGVTNATNIAELGIGHQSDVAPHGDITEVKKRLGTAHMALGDSAAGYGGLVSSEVHLDGMIMDVQDGSRRRGDRGRRKGAGVRAPPRDSQDEAAEIVERCRRLEGGGLRTFAEDPPLVWERAAGASIIDATGRQYLICMAALP